MKVRFEQTGGWGNPLGRYCELDTEQLEAPEAEALRTLVKDSRLSRSRKVGSPDARDAVAYTVRVERGGKVVEIAADDATLPERLRPLVEFLQRRARPRPGA
jgi:hypothetical protein